MSGLDDVPRETLRRLETYRDLIVSENDRQNLIAPSTVSTLWGRHILDSAQLARLAPSNAAWIDIGSGAGLPGVVLACLGVSSVKLVEPRRLRVEFLARAITALELGNASVACAKAERMSGQYDVITARAVAPLDRLLAMSEHLSHRETLWILPKGKNAQRELAEARRNWHCTVRAVPSETDPAGTILLLGQVEAKR